MKYLKNLWRLFLNLFASNKTFLEEIKELSYEEGKKLPNRITKYNGRLAYRKVPSIENNNPIFYPHTTPAESHIDSMRRKLRALRLKNVVLPFTRNKYGLQFPSIIR